LNVPVLAGRHSLCSQHLVHEKESIWGKAKEGWWRWVGRVDREHAMIGPMTARAATSHLAHNGQRALFAYEIMLKIGFCSRPARLLWPYHNSSFFIFKFHLATWGRSFIHSAFLVSSSLAANGVQVTSALQASWQPSARKKKTRRSSDTGTKAAICVTSLPAIGSRGPLWFHHSHCECL